MRKLLLLLMPLLPAAACTGPGVAADAALPDEVVADLLLPDGAGETVLIPGGGDATHPDMGGRETPRAADWASELPPGCAPGEGCFGDQCTDNSDCQSGWCVQHLGEGVCTQMCQEECPQGWSCRQVAGTDPDLIYVCVSDYANLCRPCAANVDCTSTGGAEDACIDYGPEGSFCGGPCGDASAESGPGACPWGFSCQEVTSVEGSALQQCVNDTGECPCTASSIALGLTTPCAHEDEFGTCGGTRT